MVQLERLLNRHFAGVFSNHRIINNIYNLTSDWLLKVVNFRLKCAAKILRHGINNRKLESFQSHIVLRFSRT